MPRLLRAPRREPRREVVNDRVESPVVELSKRLVCARGAAGAEASADPLSFEPAPQRAAQLVAGDAEPGDRDGHARGGDGVLAVPRLHRVQRLPKQTPGGTRHVVNRPRDGPRALEHLVDGLVRVVPRGRLDGVTPLVLLARVSPLVHRGSGAGRHPSAVLGLLHRRAYPTGRGSHPERRRAVRPNRVHNLRYLLTPVVRVPGRRTGAARGEHGEHGARLLRRERRRRIHSSRRRANRSKHPLDDPPRRPLHPPRPLHPRRPLQGVEGVVGVPPGDDEPDREGRGVRDPREVRARVGDVERRSVRVGRRVASVAPQRRELGQGVPVARVQTRDGGGGEGRVGRHRDALRGVDDDEDAAEQRRVLEERGERLGEVRRVRRDGLADVEASPEGEARALEEVRDVAREARVCEGVLQDERGSLARVERAPAPPLLPPSLHRLHALAELRQRC